MAKWNYSNCILFALKLHRLRGGYIVFRGSNHKHWWPIGIHALWHPKNCPEKGKPCPYLRSYVPTWKGEPKFPPPLFKGKPKSGDD